MRRYWALTPLLALAACASPADVRANHDRAIGGYMSSIDEAQDGIRAENREFTSDLAFAETWDSHWWGIPAGGWVAILISFGACLAIALCVWSYFAHERRRVRRNRDHDLAVERERTERRRVEAAREVVQRGNCQVCGGAPIPAEVLKEITDDRT